ETPPLPVGGATRLQGGLLGQEALGQMPRRGGDGTGLVSTRQPQRVWRPGRRRAGRADAWGRRRRTGPYQYSPPFIHGHALAFNEFGFHIVQVGVIELARPLEGAISQTSAPLEHGDRLVEDLLKGHRLPSLC